MAHDDPFTIDLFGNKALASGFDLGLPGFAADFGTDLNDDPPPSKPAPGRSSPQRAEARTADAGEGGFPPAGFSRPRKIVARPCA